MSYSTPHGVREYVVAACLRINHEYVLHCQRRARDDKRDILLSTREIDLCGRVTDFFGRAGHLAAQGIARHRANDIEITGPTIRCEAKFYRPSRTGGGLIAQQWVDHDWQWLTEFENVNNEFNKRAWLVFWPSVDLFRFTQCLSITRSHGPRFCSNDFAPFMPFAEPRMPPHGVNQRLSYKNEITQVSRISVPGGRRVRCDIIGSPTHPLWATIYTRMTPDQFQLLNAPAFEATNDAIAI